MTERTQRAAKLACNTGVAIAVIALVRDAALVRAGQSVWRGGAELLGITLLSFALFFVIVFPLAYWFPPDDLEPRLLLRFPGARKIVWPVVALMVVAVAWLVVRAH
jgi:hypothetical protein